ncbi:PorP/SprF family type IX secretion system membrane protein [Flavicella sp.]|uniref:PorP/SprF family type IX secretion system membrane protein n=1 Tax=Flavicella sp. TaxID=2957742 RepID=UPI0030169D42
MTKYKVLIVCLLLGVSFYGQETAPSYLLYQYNMNILNPAYAGVSEKTEIGFGFRKKQMEFNDDSGTQFISFSKGIGRNLGIGISIVNDKVFISKETSTVVDISYKLQMDRTTNLYFGMKAGGTFYSIDFNSLGVNDPLFADNISTFSPVIGVGAYLKGEHYFINLSSPNVILSEVQSPRINSEGEINSEVINEKLHVYLGGGYQFSITETIDLTPSVFSRFVSDEDLLLDISAVADFSNKVEAGITYRLNTSVVGSVLLKIVKNTSFGYAYESTTSKYSALSSGTHEFIVKFSW